MNSAQGPSATCSPGRVLVVDDHAESRGIVTTQLSHLGFQVIEADSAEGCLTLIDGAENPRVEGVVLDLQLAMPDGHNLLSDLRRRHAGIPVIVVSELTDVGRAREAIRLGAQEYLVKPFDLELLRSKCLRVFMRRIEQNCPC
ncbi:hypothetical protein YTPLAS18_37440 [Nitrospira sp.]|nr:hypothetical protein YTPLAS18_37440 [Nitrospira sp.]